MTVKISAEDINRAFHTFDSDNDGKIGSEDWKRILSILKQQCKYELEDMDFEEFQRIANEISEQQTTDQAIKKTFRMIDTENKGYISAEDLRKIMTKLGNPLTDEEIDEVIKDITDNKSETITMDVFQSILNQ